MFSLRRRAADGKDDNEDGAQHARVDHHPGGKQELGHGPDVRTSIPAPTAATDCPDPRALAAFYQEATGLDIHPGSGGDFAGLTRQDGRVCDSRTIDGNPRERLRGR
jgi:hypothetical protein